MLFLGCGLVGYKSSWAYLIILRIKQMCDISLTQRFYKSETIVHQRFLTHSFSLSLNENILTKALSVKCPLTLTASSG